MKNSTNENLVAAETVSFSALRITTPTSDIISPNLSQQSSLYRRGAVVELADSSRPLPQ
jgi:hypothetical protein